MTSALKQRMNNVSLSDKYELNEGRVFLNGNQALVKALMLRKAADEALGFNTSGYVSGYRGSPLGGFDSEVAKSKKYLAPLNVSFHPGVNEELAATSILGTQQFDSYGNPLVDGVFSLWYGKGPGVDRAADALRHGNSAGSHPKGGVVVAYGDDHPGKSSTVAHQSEQTLSALSIPSLYPSNVKEMLEYALLAWDMSRYTGLWVGLKCVNETVEQTASINLPEYQPRDYTVDAPENIHVNARFFNPKQAEVILVRDRLPRVAEFVREHKLNKPVFGLAQPKFGIITSGKAYGDLLDAFTLLGIDESKAQELGLGVFKVGCIWPLESQTLLEFAENAEHLFCVEEKKPFVELQLKELLFNNAKRPSVSGKKDLEGNVLLPSDLQLNGFDVARAITKLLSDADLTLPGCFNEPPAGNLIAIERSNARVPYFCSGCPHNSSTKLPDGAVGMTGIGCHGMISMHKPGSYLPPTQMGGEGLTWVGASKYSETKHAFQNLGDGTYFHSGVLAIRAAISAGTNITYKLLYNDAVAMTGGQPIDGSLPIPMLYEQIVSEGVKECVIVTDDLSKYDDAPRLIKKVVRDRHDMDEIQKRLAGIEGVTVIIYEQTCAAEKRRRRKRGLMPDPERRTFIFDPVCEGCGDCSQKSSCVSILPKPTPTGLKRRIDQDNCNKDYTCVDGYCPSFITVHQKGVKKAGNKLDRYSSHFDSLKLPSTVNQSEDCSVLVSGIGGTGVVTVAAIVGMAAHIESRYVSIFDMTGLAQKNGAVFSHLRIAKREEDIKAARIGAKQADLIMAFDLLAMMAEDSRFAINPKTTKLIGNGDLQPTAYFALNPNKEALPQEDQLSQFITSSFKDEDTCLVNATGIAKDILGTAMGTNMFMVGLSYQTGSLPLSCESIEQAIQLNGTAVELNLAAFRLGRLYIQNPELFIEEKVKTVERLEGNDRTNFFSNYANSKWADRYQSAVNNLAEKVNSTSFNDDQKEQLIDTYSWQLFRVMTYKDEYEVARLYASESFKRSLAEEFGDDAKISFNLAPPMLHYFIGQRKITLGSWALSLFKVLRPLKVLRGTSLDIFGYTEERRMERHWIQELEMLGNTFPTDLTEKEFDTTLKLIETVDQVRGYGHVKVANMKRAAVEFALLRSKVIK